MAQGASVTGGQASANDAEVPPADDAVPAIHVLVVDDEPEILEELMDSLAQHRIAALAAPNGEAALAILTDDPTITVLLTDLNMAGMNGLALAERALAARAPAEAIEVVILTGHATIQYAVDALRTRVFDFVRKPPLVAELIASLRRAHAAAGKQRIDSREQADLEKLRADLMALRDTAWSDQLRLAEALDRAALGERTQQSFLSLISHELRTPLTPIIGFAELIEQNTQSLRADDLKDYARFIREAGETLSDLTRSILDLTQLTNAPGRLRIGRLAPARLLEELHARFAARLEARRLTMQLDCDPGDHIETDRERLLQALGHLLGNGIRFAPEGGSVTLHVRSSDDDMNFSVIDTGHGGTADDAAPIYYPFEQIDPAMARTLGGLGLQLTLCALLADQLGGRLLIDSTRTIGTRARLVLPRAHAAPPSADA